MTRPTLRLSMLMVTGMAACGGPHKIDVATDAGMEPTDASSGTDAGLDAGTDAAVDAGHDAGLPTLMTGDGGGSLIGPTVGDFAGYHAWLSFDGGSDPADGLDVVGQRTLYLNQAPPHGSTSFPVGTIIVKDIDTDGGGAQTFAMYKRGDGYNAGGAAGWEWLEVAQDSGGGTIIVWSGTAPPRNMTYSGLLSCNACHSTATSNDSVEGSSIQLSNF